MRARTDHTPSIYKILLDPARKYTYAADTIGTFRTYSIQHYMICKILKK